MIQRMHEQCIPGQKANKLRTGSRLHDNMTNAKLNQHFRLHLNLWYIVCLQIHVSIEITVHNVTCTSWMHTQ